MERLINMTQLKELSMKKWIDVTDKVKEQALIASKSSRKIKKALEDKHDAPGEFKCNV